MSHKNRRRNNRGRGQADNTEQAEQHITYKEKLERERQRKNNVKRFALAAVIIIVVAAMIIPMSVTLLGSYMYY